MKAKRKGKEAVSQEVRCDICGATFQSKRGMAGHMSGRHGVKWGINATLDGLCKQVEGMKQERLGEVEGLKLELGRQIDGAKLGLSREVAEAKLGLERQIDKGILGLQRQLDDVKLVLARLVEAVNKRDAVGQRVVELASWIAECKADGRCHQHEEKYRKAVAELELLKGVTG